MTAGQGHELHGQCHGVSLIRIEHSYMHFYENITKDQVCRLASIFWAGSLTVQRSDRLQKMGFAEGGLVDLGVSTLLLPFLGLHSSSPVTPEKSCVQSPIAFSALYAAGCLQERFTLVLSKRCAPYSSPAQTSALSMTLATADGCAAAPKT